MACFELCASGGVGAEGLLCEGVIDVDREGDVQQRGAIRMWVYVRHIRRGIHLWGMA